MSKFVVVETELLEVLIFEISYSDDISILLYVVYI